MHAWFERGDAYLATVRAYTPASGDLSEQFDQRSGAQTYGEAPGLELCRVHFVRLGAPYRRPPACRRRGGDERIVAHQSREPAVKTGVVRQVREMLGAIAIVPSREDAGRALAGGIASSGRRDHGLCAGRAQSLEHAPSSMRSRVATMRDFIVQLGSSPDCRAACWS
jgi:hypothetical protein